MRPAYETASDKTRENEIIDTVASKFGAQYLLLPAFARMDALLYRDDTLVAISEVKVRTCKMQDYKTYMLSESKWQSALDVADLLKVDPFLVVSWDCGRVGLLNMRAEPQLVDIGGRKDRGDHLDIERVVHFNISDFRVIV